MFKNTIAIVALTFSVSTIRVQSEPSLPADAQALRAAYHQARDRALQPITSKYITELTRLLDAHTKAGRLDEAVAIRKEIDLLNVPAPLAPGTDQELKPNSKAEKLRAELSGSRWNLAGHRQPHIMTLEPDGKISYEPSEDAPRVVAWFVDESGEFYTRESMAAEPRKSVLERGNKEFSLFWGPKKTATRIKDK